MSEPTRPMVPFFGSGFDLCVEVLESGAVDFEKRAGRGESFLVDIPEGMDPGAFPPGSFAVFIEDDNDFLFWPPELRNIDQEGRGKPVAFFEPFHGPIETPGVYLSGDYDTYHRWLDRATVHRVGAVLEGKAIDRGDDGKLDFESAQDVKDLFTVGRLIIARQGKATLRCDEEAA